MAVSIGTYPKWVARFMRWYLKRQGCGLKIQFYGRSGTRRKGSNRLRLGDAKRIAIYLESKSREHYLMETKRGVYNG